MSVEVLNESGVGADEGELAAISRYVLDQLHVHPQADLSVVLVDEDAMSVLHERWMDEAGPTDVMSFPMDELRPGSAGEPTPPGLLGDVVLCPAYAAGQARRAGHALAEELLLLTVHGILHLLGHDHAEREERETMFALQRRLLLTFLAGSRPDGSPAPRDLGDLDAGGRAADAADRAGGGGGPDGPADGPAGPADAGEGRR